MKINYDIPIQWNVIKDNKRTRVFINKKGYSRYSIIGQRSRVGYKITRIDVPTWIHTLPRETIWKGEHQNVNDNFSKWLNLW